MRRSWHILALSVAGAVSLQAAAMRHDPPPAAARPSSSPNADPWRATADLFFKVVARDDSIPDAGLPRAVAQDGQGFVWLATDAGLARWDGAAFKTYTTEAAPAAGALPEPMVNVLFADRGGRLWLGMSAEGLLWHDPAAETFRRPSNRTLLDRAHVLAIVDDGAGGLWVGSDRGLAAVGRADRRVTIVPPGEASGLPPGAVRAVAVAGDGALWVAQGRTVFRRARNARRFAVVPTGLTEGAVTALQPDGRGRIWVATSASGVLVVDPAGRVQRMDLTADGRSPMLGTMIDAGDGRLWAMSRSGIFAIDVATRRVRRLTHDPAIPGSVPEDGLNNAMRDRSGLIWVVGDATLAYVDPAPRRVLGIVGALQSRPDRMPDAAWSVGAAPDGAIWYGSADAPAARLVPDGDRVGRRTVPGARRGVLSFAFAPGGATYTAGEDGVFVVPASGASAVRLSSLPWSRMLRHGPTLYVGGEGVATLDVRHPAAPTVARWSAGLTDPRVRSLAVTGDGALWVGTASGLNRVDPARGVVTQIRPRSAAAPDLRANFISTLLVDRAGRLWAGTLGGGLTIFRRDGETWRSVRHLGRRDGLPHDTIDKLLPGRDGRIWASTDGGIVGIDPQTLAIDPLRSADGVAFVANWTGGGDILPDGRLVFAGFGGLTIVDPLAPARRQGGAPLRFTAVRANGGAIVPPAQGQTLVIGANDRSLTAEFARLDYAASHDQAFAYRLEPLERGWTPVDAQHTLARYTNLPPGRSTLIIRALAAVPGGGMRPTGAPLVLALDVERRWSETWGVRIVAGVATIAVVWGLLHLRMRSARKRQRRLESLVERRTSELLVSQLELEKLAYSDTLTGLGNRRRYAGVLGRLLATAGTRPFALLLIDLDRFKQVNDELGHDTGDALLVEVADRLTSAIRQRDGIFRLGGDEFGIVVTDIADAQAVEDVCRRLYAAFVEPVAAGANPIVVALSVGAVIVDTDGQAMEAIYRRADQALYDAKRAGRGTWRLASSGA